MQQSLGLFSLLFVVTDTIDLKPIALVTTAESKSISIIYVARQHLKVESSKQPQKKLTLVQSASQDGSPTKKGIKFRRITFLQIIVQFLLVLFTTTVNIISLSLCVQHYLCMSGLI